jgi:broad specificity phosphatase PhoE
LDQTCKIGIVSEHFFDMASASPSVLYLVRHGEAAHNLVDHTPDAYVRRRDAKLNDPALTDLGVLQARTACDNLRHQLHARTDGEANVVVSSTLKRALQTAEIAALPCASCEAPCIALDLAVEVQFDDIWNEPRDSTVVGEDWKGWMVEGGIFGELDGPRLLESGNELISRCERLWKRLAALESPVVILVCHGCLLFFLQRRLSIASGEAVPEELFKNAEVRRCIMPPYDGKELTFADLCRPHPSLNYAVLGERDVQFWKRHQRRTDVVNKARQAGIAEPSWAAKEWRYVEEVEGEELSDP